MKRLAITCVLLAAAGCGSFAENRKVTVHSTGVAAVSSAATPSTATLWWRTPYTAKRTADNPWDAFVPPRTVDSLNVELEYFDGNIVKWPKKLRPAYNPKPLNLKGRQLKSKNDATLRKKPKKLLIPRSSKAY